MKKRIIATILALVAVVFLASCAKGGDVVSQGADTTVGQTTAADATDKVTDFTVYTRDGEKVSLYEKLEKGVVLNFWASWCPPCRSEMPAFDKLYGEYGGEVEFMMVDLTDGSRETVESAAGFISDNGYSFPVYYDSDMDAAMKYGVSSIPMTLFIDSDGTLVNYHRGAMTEAALRAYLEEMR